MTMANEAYLSRGVSPSKDDVKAAVKKQSKGLFPGSFAKIIEDLAGDEQYCTVMHADGAGTKSSAAYLMYKETGSLDWFKGLAQDALVMNTDDLVAVGATNQFYLSNTIGRNAHRIPGACIAALIEGYDEVIKDLAAFGIDIIMTGGETADVGDLVKTMICDSTVVSRMKRQDVINAANIQANDVIIGLSSTGQTSYEKRENSGVSSNGLTAARHLLLHHDYYQKYPEIYSETLAENQVFCGQYKVSDALPNSNLTAGEALLSPTRTYLPVMKAIFKEYRAYIHGIIHCTGGGLVKCKDFSQGIKYIKNQLFPTPPIFQAIYESGQISAAEMYHVFNMGHRMEIYCQETYAKDIIRIAQSFNLEAKIIGYTEANTTASNEVVIEDKGERFVWN